MSRSIWKPNLTIPCLKKNNKKSQPKRVYSRASIILPSYLSDQFRIYNGKNWLDVKIVEEMVGHRFGEFSSTRKKANHKKDKKKQSSRSTKSAKKLI